MVTVKFSTFFQSQESWLSQIWSHYLCVMEEVLRTGSPNKIPPFFPRFKPWKQLPVDAITKKQ